jgi:hypothetical protein
MESLLGNHTKSLPNRVFGCKANQRKKASPFGTALLACNDDERT